jgi:hypothetical protein
MARKYLSECPSQSFTLRDLGSRFAGWLAQRPDLPENTRELALEMAKLEWAHIEAFDAAEYDPLGAEAAIADPVALRLQPYLRLLQLHYAVDDLLLAVRAAEQKGALSSRQRAKLLRSQVCAPLYIAVHRVDFSVHYKRLAAEAYRLLSALRQGRALEEAIDFAFQGSTMPEDEWPARIEQWFSNWMALGWFCAK